VSQTRSGPVGLLVEAVCETLIVQTSKIKPAEDAAGGLAPEFVKGFLPTDRRMITVLDLAELLPQRRYVVECEASLAS
jgi:chemotaxis signal transduction protein